MTEDNEVKDVLESIKKEYGYDFTEYAQASIKRRINHFMENYKIRSLALLKDILIEDENLFEQFVQELTVNVTEMFRDPLFYKNLNEKVITRLETYPFIKIWIAGCATGEEVYSLAILLKEKQLLSRSIIYATDINQYSLQLAKEGIFPINCMKKYTENYLKAGGKNAFSDYYKAKYNGALIDKALKENIVFSIHNLTTDTSFNEFQLIMCRNVLIYFNQNLQNKVIDLFYSSLCHFGFLVLGDKESLHFCNKRDCFEKINNKGKIYIKNA